MKKCSVCLKDLPLSDFQKRGHRNGVQRYVARCKSCVKEAIKLHPEPSRRAVRRYQSKPGTIHKRRLRRYRITDVQFQSIVSKRNGSCHICGNIDNRRMVIDHCHITGKVRGYLCHKCNSGLGHFNDSVETLKSAIEYIEAVS